MPTLVLAVDQFSWMMSSVPQVSASYWSVLVDQSCHTIASTLLMLEWDVKVQIIYLPGERSRGVGRETLTKLPNFHTQLLAQLVNCDWQEVVLHMKAEWRSA